MEYIIDKIRLEIQNKKTIIACSTGVDSSTLLHLAMKAIPKSQIIVAHVNHHKRMESYEEAQYLKEFCNENQIKYYETLLPEYHHANFQAWAREKRYAFFKKIQEKENAQYLLLAHHQDDLIETIIMRLIRSTSLSGYQGIQEKNYFESYTIFRPLLNVSKHDIYRYANNNNIKYFEDKSNESNDYLRNRLRHDIIPLMKQENPQLNKAIEHFQSIITGSTEIVFEKINEFINTNVQRSLDNTISFKTQYFIDQSEFLQIQILFELLKSYHLSEEYIMDLIKQIKSNKSYIWNDTNNQFIFIKEYGNIIFTKNIPFEKFCLKISCDGEYILPNNKKLLVHKNICYFYELGKELCYNIPDLPIYVRQFDQDDKFRFKEHHKKVADYLTDQKVSHLVRQYIYVLSTKAEKDGEIIALLGFWIGQRKEKKNG